MSTRGALIAFEGCDKSGKTTQIQRLVTRFNDEGEYKVNVIRFPDRTTEIGRLIDQYLNCHQDLDDHVVHLLFSANRWEKVNEIITSLNSGTTLLLDRYVYSGTAFSAAKKNMNFLWCQQSDKGLPQPDLVCFLNMSEQVAKTRTDFGGERYEKSKFQNQVRLNYEKLRNDNWINVEVEDNNFNKVHEQLYQIIKTEIKKPRGSIVGRLWECEPPPPPPPQSCRHHPLLDHPSPV
jgi:dTMP kinase